MRRLFWILAGLSLSSTAYAAVNQQPIEPIEVPPSVEQGLDMVYIDRSIAPSMEARDEQLHDLGFEAGRAAPIDMFLPVHPLYTDLRRALVRYEMDYGNLPQVQIPAGPVLKLNTTGDRVALLRQRLGLAEGAKFDAPLAEAVKKYQAVHGLKADGVAGAGTIDSLNLGYKRLYSDHRIVQPRMRRGTLDADFHHYRLEFPSHHGVVRCPSFCWQLYNGHRYPR